MREEGREEGFIRLLLILCQQISAPQVSIGVSGILNASGMGYGSGQGPGAGRNISMHTASGGSYGGN